MHLLTIRGIKLQLHWTFFLLPLFLGYSGYQESGMQGAMMSVGAVCLVFVCVALHELGHCAAARYYGINIYRIVLLPIGGLAQMGSLPRTPVEELVVTFAGPLVNGVLAGLSGSLLWILGHSGWDNLYEVSLVSTVRFVLAINVIMGLFNLLPIFPMDGGRIFRAILSFFLPYLTATRIAVYTAKILAFAGMMLALFFWNNWLLALVMFFIFFSADQELKAAQERALWQDALAGKDIGGLKTPPPTLRNLDDRTHL